VNKGTVTKKRIQKNIYVQISEHLCDKIIHMRVEDAMRLLKDSDIFFDYLFSSSIKIVYDKIINSGNADLSKEFMTFLSKFIEQYPGYNNNKFASLLSTYDFRLLIKNRNYEFLDTIVPVLYDTGQITVFIREFIYEEFFAFRWRTGNLSVNDNFFKLLDYINRLKSKRYFVRYILSYVKSVAKEKDIYIPFLISVKKELEERYSFLVR
jgi:hypothetical protein